MRKKFFQALLVCTAVVMLAGAVALAVPGAQDDPVVTLSYIENVFWNKVQQYIDQCVSSTRFGVVSVAGGSTVICEEGTELILRMGTAAVIATEKGGLSDVTAGEDIRNGEPMPSNHQLIVPVGDGRGFKATSDVIVLLKGQYKVQ